jgi:hypothetical protein
VHGGAEATCGYRAKARSARRPAIGLGRSSSHLDDDLFIAAGRNAIVLSGYLASTGPGFHL